MNTINYRNDFYEQVWEVVKQIPKGRVTSFGAIAAFLGSKQSSRLVGYALNALKYDLKNIPAHRVVNRNGLLTGKIHFEGESMCSLLRAEGISVKNDMVQNLEKYFWNPEQLVK
jgi:methylated-DNA-protein-cysteine methyltransferase-like protein